MSENDNLKFLEGYKTIAIMILAIVLLIYLFSYTSFHFTINNIGDFGTIGDFFGGILNPIFALLGLFALLATIRIQSKELELSRIELAKSVKALKAQNKSFKAQHTSIKQQNFENTFFNMLAIHNKLKESLNYDKSNLKIEGLMDGAYLIHDVWDVDSEVEKDTISLLLKFFYQYGNSYNTLPTYEKYSYDKNKDSYEEQKWVEAKYLNQYDRTNKFYIIFHSSLQQIYGHYFNNMYQVLKFISSSNVENKKFYSNLFRAQFSSDELELLFYNCVSDIGAKDFLPLLIQFEFLEHLPFNPRINKKDIYFCMHKTLMIDGNYRRSKIFGKNERWENEITIIEQNEMTYLRQ